MVNLKKLVLVIFVGMWAVFGIAATSDPKYVMLVFPFAFASLMGVLAVGILKSNANRTHVFGEKWYEDRDDN